METNAVPKYDMDTSETGCCPRFEPEHWDDQKLHFEDKLFARVPTWSFFHIPLNMGSAFKKAFAAIDEAGALSDEFAVLSRDPSQWRSEHYFTLSREVPGLEMTRLSGDFRTKVFEGPYRDVPKWNSAMEAHVRGLGETLERMFFFYTTCPRCSKHYGKNFVVAVAKVSG